MGKELSIRKKVFPRSRHRHACVIVKPENEPQKRELGSRIKAETDMPFVRETVQLISTSNT